MILASAEDAQSRIVADAWSKRADVRLLVPRDLSRSGWRYDMSAAGDGTFVASGDVLPVAALKAVYTRLDVVREADVEHVRSVDRAYVAAEMNAFLTAWLTTLPCAVVNSPSAMGLNGPGWTWERWALEASRAGLVVASTQRTTGQPTLGPLPVGTSVVQVIGGRCTGAPAGAIDGLIRLAGAAGVDTMSALLSPLSQDPQVLLDFSPWLNFDDSDVVDATLKLLLSKARP